MRTVTEWLGEYGASHQHPTNKLLHWICVPPIVLSVLGLLWSIWDEESLAWQDHISRTFPSPREVETLTFHRR